MRIMATSDLHGNLASHDFTQGGGMGEVGNERGVESDAGNPLKSMACKSGTRLHPPTVKGVESGGEVGLPMREEIRRIREGAVGGAQKCPSASFCAVLLPKLNAKKLPRKLP